MKISVIIPFHHTRFLREALDSVLDQIYPVETEIILIPNGPALNENLAWLNDIPNARVLPCPKSVGKIGALKAFGFKCARGDVLVELDHDDILTPDCLSEVVAAFEQNPDVGFVYSDDAHLSDGDAPFVPYNPYYGWRAAPPYCYRGQGLCVMQGFEPDAGALSRIHYAPDHVRAWRASTYREIGGHDASREILDDHELLIRTYLHTKMLRIPKCLYVYRHHGQNTSGFASKRNAEIQISTVALWHQHGLALAEREAELRGLTKVDIGGGIAPAAGYLTIDRIGADVTHDLNVAPWPLETGSVGVLRASHVIEHLRDPLTTMRESHRVLADGAFFMIEVPSTDGRGAWCDPTHTSYWNEVSFHYYTRRDQAQYIRNTDIRFQAFRLETHFPNDYFRENQIPCVTAWLRAVKSDERRPHPINI